MTAPERRPRPQPGPAAAPEQEPVGLELARVARTVGRAFDAALAGAGGSLPTWLILLSVKRRAHGNQRQIADAVGIEGATLTHHLHRLEAAGVVNRRRDPANRRVQRVELTDAGEALFRHLRQRAVAFDRQLRSGLSDRDLATLRRLLGRIAGNAADAPAAP